jgi:hypothetical protein
MRTEKHYSPETISRFKKERYLLSLLEDNFRDEVVRPLFLRKGLKDGRDLCGKTEEGKDTIFLRDNPLGITDLYSIQTKRGNINLSKDASANVIEAITQLKTALRTRVNITLLKKKLFPTYVLLITNGRINDRARAYISDEIKDPRILFMDRDDLIPELDEHFPEFWLGIDATKFPYLKVLKNALSTSSESIGLSDIINEQSTNVVSDETFVDLKLTRINPKLRKVRGTFEKIPDFEQIPINGVLSRKESLFIILGEAGSGKSTSLRRIAYLTCERSLTADNEDNIVIPILLRANDVYTSSDKNLLDITINETIRISPDSKPCFTPEDLKKGRALILIDALDEVGDNEKRNVVLKLIKNFHSINPKCKILLTSRDYSYIQELSDLREYRRYRVSSIDWKQADKIIKRLQSGKTLPRESSKELLRRLQEVHGIELNPLLVTVFVATSDYSKTDIPANITELFKKYTEMMLGRWDSSKGLAHQFHAPLKDFLMQKIGFEMHRRKSTSISLDECTRILKHELESRGHKKADIRQLIDEMLNRSGLFRQLGETIEFRHLLIQEFYAGRAINSVDYLQSVVSDDWWQRAIVFYFGEHPDDYVAIDALTSSIGARTAKESFQASLTIGIALQACYLLRTKNKVSVLKWVIQQLTASQKGILDEGRPDIPLTAFIHYYIFGRDAVACSVLCDNIDEIKEAWEPKLFSSDENEMFEFWCIVGLIECGAMLEAEKRLRKFRPNDRRLLLAIHLGCFLVSNLRVSTKEQKKLAEKMMQHINSKITDLKDKLLTEVRSELIEIQKGNIKQLEL